MITLGEWCSIGHPVLATRQLIPESANVCDYKMLRLGQSGELGQPDSLSRAGHRSSKFPYPGAPRLKAHRWMAF